jgi:molybdate transport system ATP-binding protein
MDAASRHAAARATDAAEEFDRIVACWVCGAAGPSSPGPVGGETQRVAIGRALLSRPALLLADEPLASLDAERKEEILPYFERLRDDLQVPILYVTHSAPEVARLATTVVVLENGRVVRSGPARRSWAIRTSRRWGPGTRARFWRRGWRAITRTA